MEGEKIMAQIADPWGSKAFPVEKDKLPEDLVKNVSSDYIYEELACSETGAAVYKSVLYFRIVKRFRKGIDIYDTEKVIFGI